MLNSTEAGALKRKGLLSVFELNCCRSQTKQSLRGHKSINLPHCGKMEQFPKDWSSNDSDSWLCTCSFSHLSLSSSS